MTKTKVCTKCSKKKPAEGFSLNRRMKDGLNNHCRDCMRDNYHQNGEKNRAYRKKYREKNRAAIREQERVKRQTIEGRARKAFDKSIAKSRQYGRSPELDFANVLALFKERKSCVYCDTAVGMNEGEAKPSLEHVYSLCHDLGGENVMANLQIACLTCNIRKGDLHVYEWYQRSELFTDDLWRAFIADFTSRLIGREITDAEIDEMTANLAAEAQAWKEVAQNARIS